MFNSKEISESGRSMVEMLGVLAIVGVLSVGGIAGYTTAMNMHKTNEAINNANRLAALIAGRRMLDSNAILDAEDLAGTNFVMKEDATQIVLELSGLSDTVRDKIAAMDLGNAHVDNADGKITFTFSNDLSPLGTADFNVGDLEQQNTPCPDNTTSCPTDKVCCPVVDASSPMNSHVTGYTCEIDDNCFTHSQAACERNCIFSPKNKVLCQPTCDGTGAYYCGSGTLVTCEEHNN